MAWAQVIIIAVRQATTVTCFHKMHRIALSLFFFLFVAGKLTVNSQYLLIPGDILSSTQVEYFLQW